MERLFSNTQDKEFWDLILRHQHSLYGYALRLKENVHDAEDLWHDVVIKLYVERTKYDSNKGMFKTWAGNVMRNYYYDQLKKRTIQISSIDISDITKNPVVEIVPENKIMKGGYVKIDSLIALMLKTNTVSIKLTQEEIKQIDNKEFILNVVEDKRGDLQLTLSKEEKKEKIK